MPTKTVHHELIEKVVEQYLTDIGEAVETLFEANRTGDFGLLDTLQEGFDDTLILSQPLRKQMLAFINFNGGGNELEKLLKGKNFSKLKEEFYPKFIELYRKTFAASKAEMEKELRELEARHDHLMQVIARFKGAPRALEKKQTELRNVEDDIDWKEEELVDQSEKLTQHLAELADLREAIVTAKKSKTKDGGLRGKAEAVRKPIDRIDVQFEPTGKNYPQPVPLWIEVVPVAGAKVRYAVADCKARAPPRRHSCGPLLRPAA